MLNIIKVNVPEYRQQSLEKIAKLPVMDIIPAFEAIQGDLAMDLASTYITSFQVARFYFGVVIHVNQIMLATCLDTKHANTFINLVKTEVHPETIAIMALREWPYRSYILN